MPAIKGYDPPTKGDICYIRKSYGEWSSTTKVIVNSSQGDTITVVHEPTKKTFDIPADLLTKKRFRVK